ncbi:group I truncated hemoglobin, partial [Halomonas sp. V046]|uniref:group I truncated hemoglobin n=1 Tax=Halomonas sp. V046 TaxID=3459611 RepID=UPI0040442F2C
LCSWHYERAGVGQTPTGKGATNGLCSWHYERAGVGQTPTGKGATNGLCSWHYERAGVGQTPTGKGTTNGLCSWHYERAGVGQTPTGKGATNGLCSWRCERAGVGQTPTGKGATNGLCSWRCERAGVGQTPTGKGATNGLCSWHYERAGVGQTPTGKGATNGRSCQGGRWALSWSREARVKARHTFLAIAMLALGLSGCATGSTSLYQQLGGEPGLDAVVERFTRRLADDPEVLPFFASTNIDQFVEAFTTLLCDVSDGPCTYNGPPLDRSHQHMGLTDAHFNAVVEHLREALIQEGVAIGPRNSLLGRLAPLYADIMRLQ